VREDGREFPLSLFLTEMSSGKINRERILASGELPPGGYLGLTVKIKEASMKGEEGDAALLVSEEPSRIDLPFSVVRKKATVLSLMFRYDESVKDVFRFTPAFSSPPIRALVAGLTGFVSNRGPNTVTVFDKITGQVAGVIPTGSNPGGVALDQGQRKVYVALTGEDAVEVIDVIGGAPLERMRLNAGDMPLELALTPDGQTLLTVNSGTNTVSLIDTGSLIEVARIPVGFGPRSVLLDRAGRLAYVFNFLSDTISVVDIPGAVVAATIATEAGPIRGQFSREGNRLYVIHRSSPNLVTIDPFTRSVTRKLYVGLGPIALKVDTKTNLIYLVRQPSEGVDIYDPSSMLPIDFIKAGGQVSYMTIDGEGNNLYMLIPEKRILAVVNLIRKGPVKEIDVGEDPYWVTFMGDR
jgi:YVTN family beta-propeller protein